MKKIAFEFNSDFFFFIFNQVKKINKQNEYSTMFGVN